MELEQILKLIDAVSKSALTGFSLEEGETKLTLTAERVKEFNPVQQTKYRKKKNRWLSVQGQHS